MRTINLFILVLVAVASQNVKAQKETIGILNIDARGIYLDAIAMGNLVRLEVEKTNKFSVLDKYDLAFLVEKEKLDITECYGRICLVEAGRILEADKMLTGSVEKFDDKIILILRLIDIQTATVEKTDIMEYLDVPELQYMVQISVNNILGIENDPNHVNLLSSYENPINSAKTQLKLNGPRMGMSFIGGEIGDIIVRPESEGGYGIQPITAMVGYQFEQSYLSSGDFQALVEVIPMVGGLEQSKFKPTLSILNGLRSNKNGWEIGFGPIIEFTQKAEGYYDENADWHLREYNYDEFGNEIEIPYDIETRVDSRGNLTMTTAWVFAVGKTFRSGYLNIPVNGFFSMKRSGYTAGISFGFNVSKQTRSE